MSSLSGFYDEWADEYDATHVDWQASIRETGALLAGALGDRGVRPPATVLDCTCGIGTQAIGLALAGYEVSGTDISPRELERAALEADRFGVSLRVGVADLLDPVPGLLTEQYAVVVSANSLTHFLDDATLRRALSSMVAATQAGGIVLVTNRDYDTFAPSRPSSMPAQVSVVDGRRRVNLQLWDWDAAGLGYRLENLLLTAPGANAGDATIEDPAIWSVRSRVTRLRAWRRSDIEAAATAVGLKDLQWTQRGVQPVLTARRA